MRYLSIRHTHIYGFFSCTVLLATAAYFQMVLGLTPCPLCMMQRVVVLLLGIIFFMGLLFRRRIWLKIHTATIALVSLLGSVFALRQLWLQHLPADQQVTCSPGLGYILHYLPLKEAMKLLFLGSGDCGTVQWQWLGLTIPGWMLIFFSACFILAIINFIRLTQNDGRR